MLFLMWELHIGNSHLPPIPEKEFYPPWTGKRKGKSVRSTYLGDLGKGHQGRLRLRKYLLARPGDDQSISIARLIIEVEKF